MAPKRIYKKKNENNAEILTTEKTPASEPVQETQNNNEQSEQEQQKQSDPEIEIDTSNEELNIQSVYSRRKPVCMKKDFKINDPPKYNSNNNNKYTSFIPKPKNMRSIVDFAYNDYRHLHGDISELSILEIIKTLIVKTYDSNQVTLCNVLKQTLKATNYECDFPQTYYSQ